MFFSIFNISSISLLQCFLASSIFQAFFYWSSWSWLKLSRSCSWHSGTVVNFQQVSTDGSWLPSTTLLMYCSLIPQITPGLFPRPFSCVKCQQDSYMALNFEDIFSLPLGHILTPSIVPWLTFPQLLSEHHFLWMLLCLRVLCRSPCQEYSWLGAMHFCVIFLSVFHSNFSSLDCFLCTKVWKYFF